MHPVYNRLNNHAHWLRQSGFTDPASMIYQTIDWLLERHVFSNGFVAADLSITDINRLARALGANRTVAAILMEGVEQVERDELERITAERAEPCVVVCDAE